MAARYWLHEEHSAHLWGWSQGQASDFRTAQIKDKDETKIGKRLGLNPEMCTPWYYKNP